MHHPPRIMLNDRCLRGPLTGVGHYVAQLLDHLPREASDIELLPFYRTWMARRGDESAPPAARGPGRRPPWWFRRTALNLYQAAFRIAGRLAGCALYHEPNHIPGPWSGPIVTTLHDLSVVRYPDWHPADRVRWYEKDLPAGLQRTTHFITVSEFSRREMVELLNVPGERITVIPLGIRQVFHPRPAGEIQAWLRERGLPTEYFLYAGTIEPRKNVAGLLAAYARLPAESRRRTPLLLAGVTGWGRQTVDEWLGRLGLEDHVRVLGYVPDETLARLYAGAKALVWPTLYEGFGLPPLECMACGTPVITSRVASLPEVTGDAALLVDPQDEQQLTQAMTRVLEDRTLAETMRSAGPIHSRSFTWAGCAREHARLYRRFLGRNA